MSAVRLLRVSKNVLQIGDVDILDGTPLLDIKPYTAQFDCFQTSRAGWPDSTKIHRQVADNRFDAEPEARRLRQRKARERHRQSPNGKQKR
jgi:hypothetical protein